MLTFPFVAKFLFQTPTMCVCWYILSQIQMSATYPKPDISSVS